MFTKRKTTAPADAFVVPPMHHLNPTVATLTTQRNDLGGERVALKKEDFQLSISEGPESADSNGEARVAAMLGRPVPQVQPNRSERRTQIAHRLRDLDHALGALDRELQTEKTRASAIMRERALPEYRRMIGELSDALIAAHAAQTAIGELANRLQSEGYSSGDIGNHVPSWLGRGRGPNTSVAIALREFAQAGLINPKDIPEELKN